MRSERFFNRLRPMSESVEVSPLEGPVDATVRLPGSKSMTIRALATAALASGRSHLYGGLVADDSAAMIGVLRDLGVAIEDGSEPWAVDGRGGYLHTESPTLDARESGLTARVSSAGAADRRSRRRASGSRSPGSHLERISPRHDHGSGRAMGW